MVEIEAALCGQIATLHGSDSLLAVLTFVALIFQPQFPVGHEFSVDL